MDRYWPARQRSGHDGARGQRSGSAARHRGPGERRALHSRMISPHWVVWSPQGGYLMAMVLRAAGAATEFRKPLSLVCHFLSVPKVGPAEIQVTSLRKTRIAESLRVSLVQEGRLFLEAMLWAGDTVPGLDHAATGMPDVPGYDALAPVPVPAPHRTPRASIRSGTTSRSARAARSRGSGPSRPNRGSATGSGSGAFSARTMRSSMPAATRSASTPSPGRRRPMPTSGRRALHRADACRSRSTSTKSTESEWLLSDAHAPFACDGRIAMHQRVWSPAGALLATGTCTTICRPRPAGT